MGKIGLGFLFYWLVLLILARFIVWFYRQDRLPLRFRQVVTVAAAILHVLV